MPVPKANQRAVNKYVKNNYDRINVTMPKGKKETIQGYAERQGQSVNGYINAAIDTRMAHDAGGSWGGLCEDMGGGVSQYQPLPPGTLEAAFTAANAVGEKPADFIVRAIKNRIDTVNAPQEATGAPTEAGAVSLPPDTLKAAQEAAQAAGEAVPVFIDRAVVTQAKRDEATRKLKGGVNHGH